MKPERAFVAERAIAQHDAVLLRPAPDTAELVPVLARASERLAKALRGALAPLLGGIEPQIEPAAPTRSEYSKFTCWIPALAANSLMQIGSAPLLLTVAGESVLRLVDRAFGGSGEAPASMPKEFPLSAELMIGRIEKIVAASLSTALSGSVGAGAGGPAARPDVRAVRRDANVGQLQAMPGTTPVAELTLKVQEQGRKPWNITLAFPMDTLGHMFASGLARRAPKARPGPARPTDAPFADMPIDMTAVLVDMALPLATISRLQVGQVLPVPIARNVPLVVGDKIYAHGSIGAIEDRVAIQISQLS